jgi:gamma-glutamyltranspeptidase
VASLHANASDASTRPSEEYGGRWHVPSGLPPDSGTSHFSIVDAERNAIAMTTTVNTGFGSKVVAAGLVLNNEMDDFSTPNTTNAYGLAPSEANFIRPRKRPLSSMSPTIVLQPGQPVLAGGPDSGEVATIRAVVGASGGPRIISTTLQVLVNALLRGSDAAAAVGSPRLHHQFIPNVVYAEDYEMLDGGWEIVPNSTLNGLRLRGHDVRTWNHHGVSQLVLHDPDSRTLYAVSDRRKGGMPAGY